MFLQAVSMLLYLGLSIYFILSVYSYYIIIRIQKRSVIQFLDHEFEASEGYCNVINHLTSYLNNSEFQLDSTAPVPVGPKDLG